MPSMMLHVEHDASYSFNSLINIHFLIRIHSM